MKVSPILVVRLVSALTAILFYSVLLQTTKAASWVTNGPLHTARYNHSVTVLPNGKVLLAGGLQLTNGSNAALSSVEIFDPATGTLKISTNSMGVLRCDHTATLLPNGKVLVAGGSDGTNSFASSELYDPATETWKQTDALHTSRFFQTTTLLLNGKVLCVGGIVYTNYSYDFTRRF